MSADGKFRILLEGDAKEAIAKIDKVVKSLNDAKQSTTKLSRERQRAAREERQQRFDALGAEERRAKLTQRQINLERQLARARAAGNNDRVGALSLLASRNRLALGRLGPGAGGSEGSNLGKFLPALGVGALVGTLARVLARSVTSAIEFSDRMSDLADQTGLSKEQITRLSQAAGMASVSSGKAFESLSHLQATRSAALGGDKTAMSVFNRFRIGRSALENGDPLSIALAVQKSLGPGMIPTDAGPLQALFGRNPGKMLSVLGNYNSTDPLTSDVKNAIDHLDKVKSKAEAAGHKLGLLNVAVVDSVLSAVFNKETGFGRFFRGAVSLDTPGSIANKYFGDHGAPAPGGIRTADPGPFIKALKPDKLPPQLAFPAVTAADSLARSGIFTGRVDPEGNGLLRKQLDTAERLYRINKEQNQILREGLLN